MTLPTDSSLQRRILLSIGLVVLLPFGFIYAFVGAINHLMLPLLETLGYGPYHGRFYVTPGLAAVVVFGGLGAQIWFGPSTVLASLRASRVDSGEFPEAHATVTRLSKLAEIETPDLAVATNETPNAAAVRGPSGSAIVLTAVSRRKPIGFSRGMKPTTGSLSTLVATAGYSTDQGAMFL